MPHLERRGAAEDFLRLGRVLHARQLHHDAVGALLLDDRLRHAELVHPVAQRGDVLLEREILRALLRLGLERCAMRDSPPSSCARNRGPGTRVRARLAPCRASPCRGSERHDVRPSRVTPAVLDALRRATCVRMSFAYASIRLRERAFHVDLQQKVHASAQIEAEIHRQGADRGEPLRVSRQQIQRDDVIIAECALQHFSRPYLCLGILESHLDARRRRETSPWGTILSF